MKLEYHPEIFRDLLARQFDIGDERELKGGKRRIYFATPKQGAAHIKTKHKNTRNSHQRRRQRHTDTAA